MTRDELLAYCLAKPGAFQDEPWEGDVVAKVGGKIFAFLGETSVGVKCARTATEAQEIRDRYPDEVTVMPYIGRYGWNTVSTTGRVPDADMRELVDASYDDVCARLPKSKRP